MTATDTPDAALAPRPAPALARRYWWRALSRGVRNCVKAAREFRTVMDLGPGLTPDLRAKVRMERRGRIARLTGYGILTAWMTWVLIVLAIARTTAVTAGVAAALIGAAWLLTVTQRIMAPLLVAAWPAVLAAVSLTVWMLTGRTAVVVAITEFAVLVVAGLVVLVRYGWADGSVLDDLGIIAAKQVTPDLVQLAVARALGIAADKPDKIFQVRLATPVQSRTEGGWTVDVALPVGRTATEVIKHADAIAATLHLPDAQIEVTQGAHPGVVRLLAHAQDPNTLDSARHTLSTRLQATSVWEPARLGQSADGSPVEITLMDGPILIGGARGSGKTVGELGITAHALCDPSADVLIGDGKMVDTLSIRDVATRWVGADIAALIAMLIDAEQRMYATRDRMITLREPKLTRDLAAHHGIRPIVIIIDELAFFTASQQWTPQQRGTVVDILCRLAEYGRAFGVTLVACTQTPSAEVIHERLGAQMVMRLAFATKSARVSNAILGGDAAGLGYRTDRVGGPPGTAILRDLDAFTRLRVDFFDPGVDLERLAAFVAGLRGRLQVLPEQARAATLAQAPELLKLVRAAIIDRGGRRLATRDLLATLAQAGHHYPDGTALSAALNEASPIPVRATKWRDARGYLLVDIDAAIQAATQGATIGATPPPRPRHGGGGDVLAFRPRSALAAAREES